MKKTKLFLIVFTIFLVAFQMSSQEFKVKTQNLDNGNIKVTYQLLVEPKLENVVKNGQAFSHFTNLNQFIRSEAKGYPEYLSKQVPLMIDQDRDYSLKIVSSDYQLFTLDHPYLVGRGMITRDQNPQLIPYQINFASVRDSYFPEKLVEMEEYFLLRNVRGYNFRFNVTQINQQQLKAKVYTKIVFELSPKKGGATNVLKARDNSVVRELYQIMPRLFANYEATDASWPYEIGENGDILVIYTPRDASTINSYVTHKQNMGFTVHKKQVAKGTNVKNVIKSEYNKNKNILYVQLVGDWADIKCDTAGSSPMDPFLGAVSGNDNYIDIIIGRFSAENTSQLQTQIDKVVTYETGSTGSWWKKGLGIASGEGAGHGNDGESDFQHMGVIKNNKLLPNQYTNVAEIYKSGSPSQVANVVNGGVHVINYTGHGSTSSWGTTGFSSSNVNSLTNGNKLPFIISVACVNGAYHNTTCFAEAWLRKANGGAIGALMATINQPWVPPMIGQDYINDLLTGGYDYSANPGNGTSTDHGKKTLGSIIFNAFALWYAESSTSTDLRTIQTWILFGDSSLKVVKDIEGISADYSYAVDAANELKVNFTDKSKSTNSTITAWHWDFGDGQTSTEKNPSHTYSQKDNYQVKLTVTDDKAKKQSITKTVKLLVEYCKSSSSDCSYEWIKKIQIGTYQNASNAKTYSDFTSKVIPLTSGNHALTLTPGFKSSSYTEYWKVWIDLNQDGDFDDSGEEVFSGHGSSAVTGSLSIPASAKNGKTRMRIVMRYGKYGQPCGNYDYGETEDYTVNITN